MNIFTIYYINSSKYIKLSKLKLTYNQNLENKTEEASRFQCPLFTLSHYYFNMHK